MSWSKIPNKPIMTNSQTNEVVPQFVDNKPNKEFVEVPDHSHDISEEMIQNIKEQIYGNIQAELSENIKGKIYENIQLDFAKNDHKHDYIEEKISILEKNLLEIPVVAPIEVPNLNDFALNDEIKNYCNNISGSINENIHQKLTNYDDIIDTKINNILEDIKNHTITVAMQFNDLHAEIDDNKTKFNYAIDFVDHQEVVNQENNTTHELLSKQLTGINENVDIVSGKQLELQEQLDNHNSELKILESKLNEVLAYNESLKTQLGTLNIKMYVLFSIVFITVIVGLIF